MFSLLSRRSTDSIRLQRTKYHGRNLPGLIPPTPVTRKRTLRVLDMQSGGAGRRPAGGGLAGQLVGRVSVLRQRDGDEPRGGG